MDSADDDDVRGTFASSSSSSRLSKLMLIVGCEMLSAAGSVSSVDSRMQLTGPRAPAASEAAAREVIRGATLEALARTGLHGAGTFNDRRQGKLRQRRGKRSAERALERPWQWWWW